ncbi:uncharacterized protein Nmag_1634 [Natrialba magadii ATCC 43099]|uniref:Uncharacterized protein n=1 Tax=Natrialba magadii (strain ATCC 43099 / DSM 3394 / CCM 3739 / CIP 104546 / IAM 13178 / JCM 8861 / NBRC 102185 / NCIMB 2190 / MS3) TaxID=547559 RepID=D3SUF2_NATMM|nr:hypothetical protein [Natrialba magadii]ADD05210.1 uncharacterized protein Nmag_1634 [Natrialba magadii ATCC 43099]ELY23246.1 hypothetical protein C500_20691 [Natrialba magadii ATCC 43099]
MKYLYKIPIEEASQTGESGSLESQLAQAGVLEGDEAVVDQLSSAAPDLSLDGQFRAGSWHSQLHAEELRELTNSSIEALPLFQEDGRYPDAGYYEIESASVPPAHANAHDIYVWDLELTRKGTQQNSYRAVEPNTRQADHEFGNETDALVGVPAAARKVQWFDGETQHRAPAEPIETRESEFGDVDTYDLADGKDAVGVEDPTLVYEIDYADEAPVDCAAYDTRGESEKYLKNDDGRVRLWQSLFSTQHDFDDEIVMDNGLVRLRLDETEGTIEAEEWDSSDESWSDVGLDQPADVELWDVDLQEVAMIRDKAQLTFDVDGDLFALDAILSRGADGVLFDIPSGETGPIPEDVEEMLGAIAAEALVDPQAAKGLISRSQVRK